MNKLLKNNEYFQTSDLTLASCLITIGFALEVLDKAIPSKVQFIFKKDKSLERTIQAYWLKELKLEPQAFSANQKMLKTRLYDN